jgi:transcriptional regulator with XRE-family HTH domain
MGAEILTIPKSEHRPIAEIPAIERLGTLVKRFRLNAKKTVEETAARLEISDVAFRAVETFAAPLSVDQLRELTAFLNVRFEPFLDAARDFHRGIWEKQGRTDGVQLSEMTSKVASVSDGVVELEQTAVDVVYQTAGTAALMRETARVLLTKADELLGQTKRLQDLLVDRGVLQEQPVPETEVDD